MKAAKQTTVLLQTLRSLMQNTQYVKEPLQAYIIPSCDAHNSEYLADCDQRRAFISGFTGSAGTAIVTDQHACMWTDGRYFLQASQEMDSNWTLMKEGLSTTPSQGAWLSKTLPKNSCVGFDPKLMTYSTWVLLQSQLETASHTLIPVPTNLIDVTWNNRPQIPCNPVFPLQHTFTGNSIFQKLQAVHEKMVEKNSSTLVLTALDEIAWFLNLRGADIEFNPVFFSYVIISKNSFIVFIDPKKVTAEVEQHIKQEAKDVPFSIDTYDRIVEVVTKLGQNSTENIWLSDNANYALTSSIPPKILHTEITPVAVMKAVKNEVEIKGMRTAHIKDAVALCCYFAWLEKEILTNTVTEISAAKQLEKFRALQLDFMGPSFETISSVGPHAAIVHYKPDASSDSQITSDCIYLCDSGGQYKDGTTDITRTIHFGTPTEFQMECFTRVLKGQIKIATAVFPSKIKGNCLDSFARQFLWDVGLDYAHGTGHGVGAYLNVHEGPIGISWRNMPDDPGLEAGMFLSNEPGYYQDGEFGMRIEDIVQVMPASPLHNHNNRDFLKFETVSLVPIQAKMVKIDMLTEKEIQHFNSYHQHCRDVISPILQEQGLLDAKQWLWRETEPIGV